MNQTEWLEIQQVQLESRHELTLSGDKMAQKVSKNNGLIHESLFEIGQQLNYLKLAKLGLVTISPKISNLIQLTQLSIVENKISEIPLEMSLLINLNYLDLSGNCVESVPSVFGDLSKLRTLNLRNNQIREIVSLSGLICLQELFLGHNHLSFLPDNAFDLGQLMELDLSHNEISDILPDVARLKNLKVLNLENNRIDTVPTVLGNMARLRQLQLVGNPLRNVKTQLKKMINDNLYRAITEYLKKTEVNSGPIRSRKTNASSGSTIETTKPTPVPVSSQDSGRHLTIVRENRAHVIVVKNRSRLLRPHAVYFIVNKLAFSGEKLKKFVKFQEQLHKTECDQRKLTTIGVHDLAKVEFPLVYSPQLSDDFSIQMINSSNKPESGRLLYERLLKEAESERKNKKRNHVSGVYQYLYLIDIDQLQGVVQDRNGLIISYPPLTNCNVTKMTTDTEAILVEVIGTKLDKCKLICENIIRWLTENDVSVGESCIEIEPVRVYEDNSELSADSAQNFLVLFPSRADLGSIEMTVIRD